MESTTYSRLLMTTKGEKNAFKNKDLRRTVHSALTSAPLWRAAQGDKQPRPSSGTTSRCARPSSGEAEVDRSKRPVVDAKGVPARCVRRPRERAAEDDVCGVELLVVRGD